MHLALKSPISLLDYERKIASNPFSLAVAPGRDFLAPALGKLV